MFHSVADEQIRFVILNQDPLPPPKQRFLKSALGMLLFFVTLILLVFIAVSGLFVYSVLTAPRECKLEEAKPAEKMTLEVTEKGRLLGGLSLVCLGTKILKILITKKAV